MKQVSCFKVPNLTVLFKQFFTFGLDQNLTLESFQLCLLVFFGKTTAFEQNEHIF